jgi:hypothetical protein
MGLLVKSNCRKRTIGRRKQVIYSQPLWLFVETYLTPKGKRLMFLAKRKDAKELIMKQFGKKRYRLNPDARVVKIINHYL